MRCVLPIIAACLTIGCSPKTASTPITEPKSPQSIFARLLSVETGRLVPVGQAQMVEAPGGMKLYLTLERRPSGLAGEVGMHIHAIGKCELPDFASAGPHWNPAGKQHGLNNSLGHHAGDITNINVMLGTQATNEVREIPGATIAALLDADGSAIVIHEKADDYLTDPSGNSGKRIICGVFERP